MPRVAIRDAEYRRAYKARKGLEYYYRDHAENKEKAKLRQRERNGYGHIPGPRAQAKARGEKRYSTGKPCSNGHLATRLVSNGRCAQCMYDWRRQLYLDQPDKRRAAARQKSKTVAADPRQKLMALLRVRVHRAVKQGYRGGSAVRALGCSIVEFKQYIENLWQPEMSWENWSREGWHLDHKKPLCDFDLTNPEEFAEACHYSNYQPLWAIDNLRKNRHAYA